MNSREARQRDIVAKAPFAGERRIKLSARQISKSYGNLPVLRALDLDVADGELITLLGPSGSGKTTLLQIVCGLVEPTSGALLIDGHDQTHLPPNQRGVGVVFQHYALFPHLTVGENIAFPLVMRHVAAAEIKKRVGDALDMVGLAQAADRMPKALSGGQQQRIALARCLVYRPSIILMDEPLGALDRKLRQAMQIEIKQIHRETGATIIFVTHDQEEALALSDRICLMNDGRIAQIGTPQAIYDAPQNRFSAEFIGLSNIFEGRAEGGALHTADGRFPVQPDAADAVCFMVRPEHVRLAPPGEGFLTGVVIESVYAGADTQLLVRLPSGMTVLSRIPGADPSIDIGSTTGLIWSTDRTRPIRAD